MAATLHTEFSELARALGADNNLGLHVEGTLVHLDVRVGSKGALLGARFRIVVAQEIVPYTILLRHERALDRVGKNLAINREVQLGDAAFDKDVYIETDGQDDDVRRILRDGGVRDAVRAIVTARIESLTIGGDAVDGSVAPAANTLQVDIPTKAFREIDMLRQVCVALVRLAREIVRVEPRGPYRGDQLPDAIKPATKNRTLRGVALFVFCFAVHLIAWWRVGFGSTPPTFGWAAFEMGAVGGVVTWLVLVVVSILLLRGRSTSLRNVAIFAVASLPTIIAGGRVGDLLNATNDTSVAHVEKASVRLRSQSKGGPRREVTLLTINERVDVDGPLGQAVPFEYTARVVDVAIRDGAYGSPYIVSLSLPNAR